MHIIGSEKPEEHNGILNFTIDRVHPHDIASIMDGAKVAVRSGHHCAQPLLEHLGVLVTTRASISFTIQRGYIAVDRTIEKSQEADGL